MHWTVHGSCNMCSLQFGSPGEHFLFNFSQQKSKHFTADVLLHHMHYSECALVSDALCYFELKSYPLLYNLYAEAE